MKLKIFILVLLFSVVNFSNLFSQEVKTSVNTNENKSTEEVAKKDITAQINENLLKAQEYLQKANDSYKAGYYSQGYEYAKKAKEFANKADSLKVELSKKLSAENKINQAKTLIKEAEEKEADKYAPEELANAKTALLSAQDFFEKEEWDNSLEKGNESIAYAETCLSKIEEAKKKLEETKTPKMVEAPPINKYTGKYKIKTTYKVRLIPERRDCLWRIAEYKFIYNNPFKWPIIYKANKKKIKDPDLIYPGQLFQIPELDKNGNPIMKEETDDNKSSKVNNNNKTTSTQEDKSKPKFDKSEQQTPANVGESKVNSTGD